MILNPVQSQDPSISPSVSMMCDWGYEWNGFKYPVATTRPYAAQNEAAATWWMKQKGKDIGQYAWPGWAGQDRGAMVLVTARNCAPEHRLVILLLRDLVHSLVIECDVRIMKAKFRLNELMAGSEELGEGEQVSRLFRGSGWNPIVVERRKGRRWPLNYCCIEM